MDYFKDLIAAARGDIFPDLVIRNVKVVNVFTSEIVDTEVAIYGDRIAGLGQGYEGRNVLDGDGALLVPGFIESHFHIESTMLRPSELARLVVPRGTTCLVADPHEIANVSGIDGIEFLLSDSEDIPLDLFIMAPSCVPATEFETAGAHINAREIEILFNHSKVLGLAEVMNFPGVISGSEEVLSKLIASRGKPIDGHAPLLTGKQLNAYAAAGIQSDHECTSAEEALEKVRLGMRIMIREGTSAHDLENLLPAVNSTNSRRFMLATDDRHADDLARQGHLDLLLRKSVSFGIDPVQALQMVTINPAEHFRLFDRGAVAPGYLADLVLIEDLESFRALKVIKSGKEVASEGYLRVPVEHSTVQGSIVNTVHMNTVKPDDLRIKFIGTEPVARIIEVVQGSLITNSLEDTVNVDENGFFTPDPDQDLACLYVFERHKASGRVSKGIVKGLGMRRGAIASSVAHDSHNIICASMDEVSAASAVNSLIECGGGLCVALDDESRAVLPLPICGLISDRNAEQLLYDHNELKKVVPETGIEGKDPFMALSFLALPVIPELKITDRGLFDVTSFSLVELELTE